MTEPKCIPQPALEGQSTMRLILTLMTLAFAASVGADDLKVTAGHAGGFNDRVQWQLRIANGRVSIYSSDGTGSRAFDMTADEQRQFIALLEETRFFALKPKYGLGGQEENVCSMTIALGPQERKVTLFAYSRRKPPSEAESLELRRAFRVWDAIKVLGRVGEVPDDCREPLDIWESPPR